ncbi:MAG: hypothetical protein NTX23_01990 [Candidatus Bipolaricaulota bacterium]|nr:hypothetical protein [Candidatus Bipolaricaulota bacterium]
MTKKPSFLAPAVAALVLLFLVFATLAVPMRHGASLWEAIAVLPQAVLWVVPPILATPILMALAFRIRPHWHRLRDPEPTVVPTGSLAPIAEALRAVDGSRLARSRVLARLTRLASDLAMSQHGGTGESAWEAAQHRLRQRNPRVARFLDREGLSHLTGPEFTDLVRATLAELERQQEEA